VIVCHDQVCLSWDAEDAAEDDLTAFQLLVDGAPVGEPLHKPARQVAIDELKPGQELDVSLVPLDSRQQPLGSSNVVKAHPFTLIVIIIIYRREKHMSAMCRHIMLPSLIFDF